MSVGPVSSSIDTAVVQSTPLPPSAAPADADAAAAPTAIEQPNPPAPPEPPATSIDINLPPAVNTSA